MARKKRQAPDVPAMTLNPASENVPNVSPLPLPTIDFTRDKAGNCHTSISRNTQ